MRPSRASSVPSRCSKKSAPARDAAAPSTSIHRRHSRRRWNCAARESQRMLGLEIADPDIERILKGLGFHIRRNNGGWDVSVPTFRVDVHARSRSDRGSWTSLRLRPASVDLPCPEGADTSVRSADRARPARPPGTAGRRLLGSSDVFLHRCGAGRTLCRRDGDRADRQPVVGAVRRPAAVAAAGTLDVGRPQPASRTSRRAVVRAGRVP